MTGEFPVHGFFILCLNPQSVRSGEPYYGLATRGWFKELSEAEAYRKTCDESHQAIVVSSQALIELSNAFYPKRWPAMDSLE